MSVSATEAKNFRRETADCFGSQSGLRRPVGLAALDRVMHEIAGDHRALALREDVDAAMAGRMPRRRRQRDGVVERVVVVDQQRLPGFHDRQAIVAEHLAGRVGALGISPPPTPHIRACGRCIWHSGMSAPSARRAASCSSRCGRCADGCRTRSRPARKLMPSANSSLRQRSLPGKSNGGGWPLSSPVQVSTRMV